MGGVCKISLLRFTRILVNPASKHGSRSRDGCLLRRRTGCLPWRKVVRAKSLRIARARGPTAWHATRAMLAYTC